MRFVRIFRFPDYTRFSQNTPDPYCSLMIKSRHKTSIKRPIALVFGPRIPNISRYYVPKCTGGDLIITNAYGSGVFRRCSVAWKQSNYQPVYTSWSFLLAQADRPTHCIIYRPYTKSFPITATTAGITGAKTAPLTAAKIPFCLDIMYVGSIANLYISHL